MSRSYTQPPCCCHASGELAAKKLNGFPSWARLPAYSRRRKGMLLQRFCLQPDIIRIPGCCAHSSRARDRPPPRSQAKWSLGFEVHVHVLAVHSTAMHQ
mmetsp:Transcript_11124/g.33095  ORF Transcript_11124/g.33095 Transcript_11124/m.33095 type:complete len:99 (+) Transcript_11124:1269-1565(+)